MRSASDRPRSPGARAPLAIRPSAGWVVPAVTALLGGGAWLLAAAWRRLLPPWSPDPWVLVAACLVVGLADFALAVAFALEAGRPPDTWRPAVALAAVAFGAVAAATGDTHRGWLTVPGAGMVLLAARTAETLGRHLAPALRLPADDPGDALADHVVESRRAVLEVWVATVLGATAAGLGVAALPALAVIGASGLVVAAGARLDWAGREAAGQGYTWPEADRVQAWRGMGTLGLAALALALAVPGLPALLSGRVLLVPIRLVTWFIFGRHPDLPAPVKTPPKAHLSLPLPLLPQGGADGHGASGLWLPLAQDLLLHIAALAPFAIALLVLYGFLRYVFDPRGGDWLEPLRRLWRALRGLFDFWRWLAEWWHLREGRLARALAAAGDRGADGEPAPPRRGESWLDPRRAVRAAYRRFLLGAAAAGRPRQDPETPADYARRLSADLGPAATAAGRLTSAYEEARYSDHRIGRPIAGVAIEAMRRTVAALRRAK